MILARTVAELKAARAALAGRVAFVPTMGNLHAGHIALVEAARARADHVVASIFVNRMQFGPREDFANYPRTPDADETQLRAAGVAILFQPDEDQIYPRGVDTHTFVEVPGLSDLLCGAARPGHFRGVATVVNRLFNLVAPHVALFGKKDYQQWRIIERMVADLGMPIEIVGMDTVREPDGLAMSSRNQYLSPPERAIAGGLYAALVGLTQQPRAADWSRVEAAAMAQLRAAGFAPEYVSVRRRLDLAAPSAGDPLVVLAAARLGRARLIDNLEF